MKTPRTKLGRIPARGSHETEEIYAALDAAFLCHVGFVDQGHPFVIPTAFGRKDDVIYLHGSIKSRMLEVLSQGSECCITVTHLDALVLARSTFHHSMNYRSVVVLGQREEITDWDEKMEGLRVITEQIMPGRWDDARIPNEDEMKATRVVKIPLHEASLKARTGPVKDERSDYKLGVWAGLLPLESGYGEPIADEQLKPGIELPDYLSDLD